MLSFTEVYAKQHLRQTLKLEQDETTVKPTPTNFPPESRADGMAQVLVIVIITEIHVLT